MVKVLNVFNRINSLKTRYQVASAGKQKLLKILNETEVAEQVYNSNAIENSTLTLEETEKILLQIDLDRYISEKEIFETKNLARVVSYIDTKAKDKELSLELILLLHKMLLSNIRDEVAGRFRKENEWVKVMRDAYENKFDKAILISSDGDYASLVSFLIEKGKMKTILSPYQTKKCSILLKRTGAAIAYLGEQREILKWR